MHITKTNFIVIKRIKQLDIFWNFSPVWRCFLYASFCDSGEDYSAVRVQVMHNCAKLDTSDGFKSDSTNFIAGTKTNFQILLKPASDTLLQKSMIQTTARLMPIHQPDLFTVNTGRTNFTSTRLATAAVQDTYLCYRRVTSIGGVLR